MDIFLLADQEENMNIFFFLHEVADCCFLKMNQVKLPQIALISHTSKIILKSIKVKLQQ